LPAVFVESEGRGRTGRPSSSKKTSRPKTGNATRNGAGPSSSTAIDAIQASSSPMKAFAAG